MRGRRPLTSALLLVVGFALIVAGAPRALECGASGCGRPTNPLEPVQPFAALGMVAAAIALAWSLEDRRRLHFVPLSWVASLAIIAGIFAGGGGGSGCTGSSLTGMSCYESRPVWVGMASLAVAVACVAFLAGIAARRILAQPPASPQRRRGLRVFLAVLAAAVIVPGAFVLSQWAEAPRALDVVASGQPCGPSGVFDEPGMQYSICVTPLQLVTTPSLFLGGALALGGALWTRPRPAWVGAGLLAAVTLYAVAETIVPGRSPMGADWGTPLVASAALALVGWLLQKEIAASAHAL